MRIVVIHQNDGTDVRVGKVCRTLSKECDVDFLGWKKGPICNSPDLGDARLFLFELHTKNLRGTPVGLLRFYFWIIRRFLISRPDVIYCVNEEMSLLLYPLSVIFRCKLVCDIFDPFADRKSLLRLYPIYRLIQRLGRAVAEKIVVTDESRHSRLEPQYRRKAVVVQNFPECTVPAIMPKEFRREVGCTYIAFVGSLSARRGVNHLAECLAHLPNLRVLCAGWIYDEVAQEFLNNERVHYFGVVTAESSRGIMAFCDAVFCIYDPAILNNYHASPNKIYDAMSVGRQVLINDGILISDFVRKFDLGLTYEYGSVDSLVAAVSRIGEEKTSDLISIKLKHMAVSDYSWESQESVLRDAVSVRL